MLVSAQDKALFTDQLKSIIEATLQLDPDPDTPLPSLGEVPMLRLDENFEVSLQNCITLNVPVVDVDLSTFNGYMPINPESVTNALESTGAPESRTTPENFAADNGYIPVDPEAVSNALESTGQAPESRTTPEDFAAIVADKSFLESLDYLFPTHG